MAAVQQNITYKREFLAGDIVEIHSRFLEAREKVLRYVHEMQNAENGEIAAVCELTVAHIDRHARKAVPLPATILDSINALLTRTAYEGVSHHEFEPAGVCRRMDRRLEQP
jgi:acyl-CoA thioester hydrolase